jgi:hypothetical protein
MRYYLRYIEKESPLRLSAYAKGTLLHDLIENFWKKLGISEEVSKKSSKKKYSNEEGFAKYAQGLWKKAIIASQNSENPIFWQYEAEPWKIFSELKDICTFLYSHLLEEGKPLLSETSFDFMLEGRRFKGRIDEVRLRDEKIVIRDYKSGRPWIGDMKLNNDPQLTFYNVGLCSLCCADEGLAEKLGLKDERRKFMGNPFYVNPEFIEEFFMIEAPAFNSRWSRNVKTINQTSRKDEHFFELLKMIKGIEKAVNEGEIYPERGRKCDYCDMKYACEKRLDRAGSGNFTDKKGQSFLDFAVPAYAKKDEREDKSFRQKKFRFRFKGN